MDFAFDPDRDLEISRHLAASPTQVWRALTEAPLLERWFCPRPWQAVNVVIEPRPGGVMHTPMRGPKGEEIDEGPGCILLADPGRALAFTDGMGPGLRPRSGGFMTGLYLLAPEGDGTRITARALHSSAEDRAHHAQMGFEPGWGAALAQLEEVASGL